MDPGAKSPGVLFFRASCNEIDVVGLLRRDDLGDHAAFFKDE